MGICFVLFSIIWRTVKRKTEFLGGIYDCGPGQFMMINELWNSFFNQNVTQLSSSLKGSLADYWPGATTLINDARLTMKQGKYKATIVRTWTPYFMKSKKKRRVTTATSVSTPGMREMAPQRPSVWPYAFTLTSTSRNFQKGWEICHQSVRFLETRNG